VTGLNHAQFIETLALRSDKVDDCKDNLDRAQRDLERIARAAHAAGMTERQIGAACGRSGPAVHAWLHAR
jgi:hypothetical protein